MAEEQQAVENEQAEPKEEQGGKTYTQDDINRMMAAKAKELESSFNDKLKEAKSISADERQKLMEEGAKRAQMTADEKAKAELEDRQKEIERQKDEFEQRMRLLDERQALSDTKDALLDAGLPKEFAGFLSSIDEDKRNSNVSSFGELFKKAVSEAVDKRVSGKKTPSTGSTTPSQPSTEYKVPKTRAELLSMDIAQSQAFMNEHPEEANALLNQR
ncbi:MAG: hypothetical protein [Caudoviricetes sp.]|nr:MAG: hypothetical protein [Caudoviricetes sp.]